MHIFACCSIYINVQTLEYNIYKYTHTFVMCIFSVHTCIIVWGSNTFSIFIVPMVLLKLLDGLRLLMGLKLFNTMSLLILKLLDGLRLLMELKLFNTLSLLILKLLDGLRLLMELKLFNTLSLFILKLLERPNELVCVRALSFPSVT